MFLGAMMFALLGGCIPERTQGFSEFAQIMVQQNHSHVGSVIVSPAFDPTLVHSPVSVLLEGGNAIFYTISYDYLGYVRVCYNSQSALQQHLLSLICKTLPYSTTACLNNSNVWKATTKCDSDSFLWTAVLNQIDIVQGLLPWRRQLIFIDATTDVSLVVDVKRIIETHYLTSTTNSHCVVGESYTHDCADCSVCFVILDWLSSFPNVTSAYTPVDTWDLDPYFFVNEYVCQNHNISAVQKNQSTIQYGVDLYTSGFSNNNTISVNELITVSEILPHNSVVLSNALCNELHTWSLIWLQLIGNTTYSVTTPWAC